MELLFAMAGILCCTVGLADLVGMFSTALLCPPQCRECFSLLVVGPGEKDVELKLRWLSHTLRWNRWTRGGKLLVLDAGADPETLEVCRAFARDREWMVLCNREELEELLGGEGVYKTFQSVLY